MKPKRGGEDEAVAMVRRSKLRLKLHVAGLILMAAMLVLLSGLFVFKMWEVSTANRAQAQAGASLADQVLHACKADKIPDDLRPICNTAYKLATHPQDVLPRGIASVECLDDGTWEIHYTDSMSEVVPGTCNGFEGPQGPPGSVVVVTVTETAPAPPTK